MGDLLEDMRLGGHLTPRQHRAAMLFLRDLGAQHGTSAGIVGVVGERVDSGIRPPLCPPGGLIGADLVLLDNRLHGLRRHERWLLGFLVQHRELQRGTLRDLGRLRSGYTDRVAAQGVAVGRIGGLLDTLADEFLGPEQM